MATLAYPFKAAVIREASGLRSGQVVMVTGDDGDGGQFAVAEAAGGFVAKDAMVALGM